MSRLNPICKADHEAVQPIVYLGKLRATQLITRHSLLKGTKTFIQGWAETQGYPRQTINFMKIHPVGAM
jgi:hypothetical protein